MIGEYDDRLEWPFEGDIYIELLNQREDSEHCSKIINLNRFRHEDDTITSRVIGKKFGSSWGVSKFIPFADLSYNPSTNIEYLQDDCLLSATTTYSNALFHKSPFWQGTSSHCVSSHSQNSPSASNSTIATPAHLSTRTHKATKCVCWYTLMVPVRVARVLMWKCVPILWEVNMTSTSSGHSQVTSPWSCWTGRRIEDTPRRPNQLLQPMDLLELKKECLEDLAFGFSSSLTPFSPTTPPPIPSTCRMTACDWEWMCPTSASSTLHHTMPHKYKLLVLSYDNIQFYKFVHSSP